MKKNESGFSISIGIILLTGIVMVIFGFFVYNAKKSEKKESTQVQNQTQTTQQTSITKSPNFKLLSGKVTLEDDGIWKEVSYNNWGPGKFCGEMPGTDAICVEQLLLVPVDQKGEFNAEQFNVQIGIFENNGLDQIAWINEYIQGEPINKTTTTKNNIELAVKKIEPNSKHPRYFSAATYGDKIIVINSSFGDYGDNLDYIDDYESLVQSLQFN